MVGDFSVTIEDWSRWSLRNRPLSIVLVRVGDFLDSSALGRVGRHSWTTLPVFKLFIKDQALFFEIFLA